MSKDVSFDEIENIVEVKKLAEKIIPLMNDLNPEDAAKVIPQLTMIIQLIKGLKFNIHELETKTETNNRGE